MESVLTSLKSSSQLTLKDIVNAESLAPDLVSVDVSVASDSSFVETGSGPAAREIKRHFDHLYGVGLSVRSPYAITAFVNQHGKQMYRVGHRELSAPAAAAQEAECRLSEAQILARSNDPSTSPRSQQRHSRLSMHHIFSQNAIFKPAPSSAVSSNPSPTIMFSRPETASYSTTVGHRKLRKTRSFGPGDQPGYQNQHFMYHQQGSAAEPGSSTSTTFTGRGHSQSVTSADSSRYTSLATLAAPSASHIAYPSTTTFVSSNPSTSSKSGSSSILKNSKIPQSSMLLQQGSQSNWQRTPSSDIFAEVMQWGASTSSRRRSFTNPSTTSLSSSTASRSYEGSAHSSSGYERSIVSGVGSSQGQRDRAFLQHPFGAGVAFDSPVRRPPPFRTKSGSNASEQGLSPTGDNSTMLQSSLSGVTTLPGDTKMWSGHPQHPHRLVLGPVKMLREMQSFDSTMTARQIDIEPSTTRGTPVSSSPHSPLRQRYSDLSDGYSDNPNLRRPPSAVLLRNIVPAIQKETKPVDNGLDETNEIEDVASLNATSADMSADLRPQTPIKEAISIMPEDAVPSGTADDVQNYLESTVPESIKLDDSADGGVEGMPTTPVPEIQHHDLGSQPDTTPALDGHQISRYTNAPDIFEVLQTYTGLPLLDRLPSGSAKQRAKVTNVMGNSGVMVTGATVVEGYEPDDGDDGDEDDMMVETTVIRMSLTTKEETAAPRDDPRFVMWGWVDDSSRIKVEEKAESKQKKRRTWRESIISGNEGDGQSEYFGTESSGKGSKKSRRSIGSKWSKKDKKEDKGKANEFGVVNSRDGDDNESQGGESSDNRAGDASLAGKKVLIAATIERWVAQLTSEIDYDELLDFFLTYRTYVSATDLCRVLMGRFYWTLQSAEDEGSRVRNGRVCDERVRRIVRVRTFVAIRCWILTFWMVDFVPNRELRLLLADFLNQLNKDPLLTSHTDGLDIVKKLIKIARECKKDYLGTMVEKTAQNGYRVERSDQSTALPADRSESDLDLDFSPDVQSALQRGYGYGYPNKQGRASHVPGVIAPNFAISPMSTLGRVVDVANHATGSVGPFEHAPYLRVDHQQNQGPLSRVVRTIGGKLKRALNARTTSTLVSQMAVDSTTSLPDSVDQFEVSAFEVDMSGDGSGSIRSGVEGYSTLTSLSTRVGSGLTAVMDADTPTAVQAFTTSQDPLTHALPPLTLPPSSHPIDDSGAPRTPPAGQAKIQDSSYLDSSTKNERPISVRTTATTDSSKSVPVSASLPAVSREDVTTDLDAAHDVLDASRASEVQEVENDLERSGSMAEGSMADIEDFSDVNADTEAEAERARSVYSTSTDSFGVPLTGSRGPQPLFANTKSPWQFDIVSIDDLDLSDTSSDKGPSAPPGLRKPVRKLPKRPLFWPRDSVSSMGIISHASMASGPSSSGMSSPALAGLGGKVEPWQLQDLLKSLRADEEEDGGVDSALKRLEGYIDPQRQEEKIKNVNEWITSIQKRMETGDYNPDVDDPRYSHLAGGKEAIDFDDAEKVSKRGSVNSEESSTPPDTAPESTTESEHDSTSSQLLRTPDRPSVSTPLLQQASSPGGPTESLHAVDSKHPYEDVSPFDVLQNKVQGFPSPVPASSALKHQPLPRLRQSFVVHYRAELLAQHFAMIDRELFMSIKFEELVTGEWTACQEVDVLDWNQYLKDRARWKAESRLPEKTSALAAVRARFNLMTNFVISEVVLTPPSARHLVFTKFLTLAYKSYTMHNFHALTAIVTGLSNDLVYKALGRQWGRIGRREHRMFADFQQLISNVDGFKYMRNMIDSISQTKPPDDSTHTASVVSGSDSKHKSDTKPHISPYCIPFIGVYLSQLYRLTKLPDLVDPTAPNLAVDVDPSTTVFDQPRYPDVFSTLAPLPPFIQLEPLINVHKQRQIAVVIKSLIAGQHLASNVHYEIDKKLFQKCLRLRASDMTTLHHVLIIYPD